MLPALHTLVQVPVSLVVDNVTKRFSSTLALDRASFTARPGEVYGFLGSNGAGKTTMMRIILGLLRPDGGTLAWRGEPTATLPRSTWGYLPEERGLYPRMTVRDELLFFAGLQGVGDDQAHRRIDAWLERLRIADLGTRRVDELSKGNQQKVQFIAAVAHEPEVFLLDEPFGGLDPVNAAILREAVLELRDAGRTIVLSTHQMETAESLCTSLSIVDRGRVVVGGELRELKRRSGRQVVRMTLDGAAPGDFRLADVLGGDAPSADGPRGNGPPGESAAVRPAVSGNGSAVSGNGSAGPAVDANPGLGWLAALPAVDAFRVHADTLEVDLARGASPNAVLRAALDQGHVVARFEIGEPSLEQIFVEHVGRPVDGGPRPGGSGARAGAGVAR